MPSLLQADERAGYDRRFLAVRQMPRPIPPSERIRVSIEDVGAGGYIRFEGKSYQVTGINLYERQGTRWPELVLYCLNDGALQYLEWEKEDEVSVYVSRETLSFERVGLRDKEQLWEISEAEEGKVEYGGQTFRYHEDSAVTFFRDGHGTGTNFHQYLFSDASKRAFMGVEEWGVEDEGYEHNVILSTYLDPKAIEVLVRGGQDE